MSKLGNLGDTLHSVNEWSLNLKLFREILDIAILAEEVSRNYSPEKFCGAEHAAQRKLQAALTKFQRSLVFVDSVEIIPRSDAKPSD